MLATCINIFFIKSIVIKNIDFIVILQPISSQWMGKLLCAKQWSCKSLRKKATQHKWYSKYYDKVGRSAICLKLGTQHMWTLVTKVIKRMLIAQTILKLLHNKFLQIWFQTGSDLYLHIGVSEWHETQATTTWAPEGLYKTSGDDNKVALLKLKYFIFPHRLGGLTQNLVSLLSVPSWTDPLNVLPVCH